MNQPKLPFPFVMVLGAAIALVGALVLRTAGPSLFATGLGALILTTGCMTAVLSGFRTPTLEPPPALAGLRGNTGLQPTNAVDKMCTTPLPCIEEPVSALAVLPESFLRWAERRDRTTCIWVGFDRWVRDALHEAVGARRVRCYRRLEGGANLVPMGADVEDALLLASSPDPLLEHVVATGRPYFREDPDNGEFLNRLAGLGPADGHPESHAAPEWLLPLRRDGETMGVIVVGEFDQPHRLSHTQLRGIANLMELLWHYVAQTDALSVAKRTDQASGVLNRIDFAAEADRVVHEAAGDGEPVVVLALSVEGIRRLDDQGRWDLRNWVMQQIGLEMQRKLRSDDLIGRFSDDRFVALLRRLDLGLGQLIARKLLESVTARLAAEPQVASALKLRCGLTGTDHEAFEPMLHLAFDALHQARVAGQDLLAVRGPSQEVTA